MIGKSSPIANNQLASILFKGSPFLLFVVDENGMIVDANERALAAFNNDPQDKTPHSLCKGLNCIYHKLKNGCDFNNFASCEIQKAVKSTFLSKASIENISNKTTISHKNSFFDWHYIFSTFYLSAENLVLLQVDDTSSSSYNLGELQLQYNGLYAQIENSRDTIWAIDVDFDLTLLNSVMRRGFKLMFDVDLEVGTNILKALPDSLVDVWTERYSRALKGEYFAEVDEFNVGDSIRYFKTSFTPIIIDSFVVGVSCVSTDITFQKQQAEELHFNKRNLLAIVENTADSIWTVDSKFQLVISNSNFRSFLKSFFYIDLEQRYNAWELMSDKSVLLWRKRYEKAFGGEHFTVVDKYTNKAGTFYYQITLNPIIESGKVEHVVCVAHDITLLKKNEESLSRSQLKYQEAQEVARIGSWEMNYVCEFGEWSDEVYRIVGAEKGEINPTIDTLLSFSPASEQSNLRQIYNEHLELHKPFDIDFQIITHDGNTKYIRIRGKSLFDEVGSIVSTIGTIQDITDQKQIELAFNEANLMKTKLFSVIAHDLRSPFNTLLGFAEILTSAIEEQDFENALEYSTIIHQSAEGIFALLTNLLAWSNSQVGRSSFFIEVVEVETVIEEVVGLFSNILMKKEITLVTGDLPEVTMLCDRNMLSTVIRNLISNAIKFSYPKGSVFLDIKKLGDSTLFSVRDEGVGMDENQAAIIFNNENLITSVGTNNEKGTGLGLMLCKEFVEKHNGKIWVESEKGKGTTFFFTIPN